MYLFNSSPRTPSRQIWTAKERLPLTICVARSPGKVWPRVHLLKKYLREATPAVICSSHLLPLEYHSLCSISQPFIIYRWYRWRRSEMRPFVSLKYRSSVRKAGGHVKVWFCNQTPACFKQICPHPSYGSLISFKYFEFLWLLVLRMPRYLIIE